MKENNNLKTLVINELLKTFTPTETIILSQVFNYTNKFCKINLWYGNKHKPYHSNLNTELYMETYYVSQQSVLNVFKKAEKLGYVKTFNGKKIDGGLQKFYLVNFNKVNEDFGTDFTVGEALENAFLTHTKNKSQQPKPTEAQVEVKPELIKIAIAASAQHPTKDGEINGFDLNMSVEEEPIPAEPVRTEPPFTLPAVEIIVESSIDSSLVSEEEINLFKKNTDEYLLEKWMNTDMSDAEKRERIDDRLDYYKRIENQFKEVSIFDDDYQQKIYPHRDLVKTEYGLWVDKEETVEEEY